MLDGYTTTHGRTTPQNSNISNFGFFAHFWGPTTSPFFTFCGLGQLPKHALNIYFNLFFTSFFTFDTMGLTTGYKVHVLRKVANYHLPKL